jgi:nucleoid-associated protein YgaU
MIFGAAKTRDDAAEYLKEMQPHKQTRNYVLFDDKHVTITHRNGEPVKLVEGNPFAPVKAADVATVTPGAVKAKAAPRAIKGATPAIGKAKTGPPPVASKPYVIRKGDTLWDMAVAIFGDGTRYHEIAKLNGIADPNKIYVGRTLKMPENTRAATLPAGQ